MTFVPSAGIVTVGETERCKAGTSIVPFLTTPSRKFIAGRTNEACHEFVVGIAVEVEWRTNLFDYPELKNNDLVSEGHGLDLVVGDVDHCCPDFFVQPGNFDTHLDPQLGVEIGKRFVEQKYIWTANDGASDSNPLTLASRERGGFAGQILVKLENTAGFVSLLLNLVFGDPVHL